ncbi:Trypsin [Popillia japonica]|uniref:Trypsin n=1 Tax=Popillia japonica TaxID=7064 RepID=A0AAW1IDJ6_POPJA
MQPAHITGNIGTMGRNIRNLPCISRKSNQSGVCMFAIDCLKANGTHLGTCIDRFYFGSCCHVEQQTHEILDNSIDSSIFPEREPPLRISSTEKITSSKLPETLPTLGVKHTSPVVIVKTTSSPIATTTSIVTTKKLVTSTPTTTTTPKMKLTTKLPIVTKSSIDTTEMSYKLTTFQSVDGISNDITTLKPVPSMKITTTPKRPISSVVPLTTKPVSLEPIISSSSAATTLKPTTSRPAITTITTTITPGPLTPKPTQRPATNKPTNKPIKVTTKPTVTAKTTTRPTQKPLRPRPTPTSKPPTKPTSTKYPTKPVRTTTKKPLITTRAPTTKLTRHPTTTKTSTTTPKLTTKTSVTTTTTPKADTTSKKSESTSSILATTDKISTVPNSILLEILTKRPATDKPVSPILVDAPTIEIILTSTPKPLLEVSTKLADNLTSTQSNDILNVLSNISTNPGDVSGNIATNEIESVKPLLESTTKPTLVTWVIPNEEPTVETLTNTTSEDWVPITTPDGWVLLPSLSSTTTTPENDTLSNSTIPPATTIVETSSTQANFSTSEKDSTVASTSSPETITQESNYTQNVTESFDTTSVQVDINITETESSVNMSDFTDVCGRRMYPKARIVGGENSSFGKWPWQISLRQWRTSTYLHKCGAALLNENWAITAAHCVDSVPPSDLLLRLGEHDLSTEQEPYLHQERRVQIVASHPQFDPRTFEYDLALLRFYEPVKFQPNILPVCVPQTDDDFIGNTAYVTGWGRLYEDGPLPSVLQEVSVPVINNTLCESMYRSAGYIEHIPHIFICAGWRRGGFDSCEGDSGGPMVIQRPDKRFLLAGVISWGIGCAEPNQPGVYTRISEFRDWINQILQF